MKNSLLVYLLLISSLQSFSQVNLNAGLMAYYPFSGNANDASGNGNNPIFNNATLTLDRFGNPNSAYLFNGTDNYIRIPNSASLNSSNQISICAWVKIAGFYEGTCHGNNIVMKGDADFQPGDYKIRFDDAFISNNQNCYISNADVSHETFFGINSTLSSNTPFIEPNQWYSVVYTCDGVTAKIYVNCKLAGSGPANGITFSNSDDLFLGSLNNAQYPYWFNGTMDEIRVYNRAINEDEVKAYGDCSTPTLSCSNWLNTPSVPSYLDIGKLNVTGNKITVEAVVNRTEPYVPGGGDNTEGDIVSKHDNPNDVNYLLRPNHAYITTTKGFFSTPDVPDIELNRTYHVAMVYDGASLKFYRDGCLLSQIAASGDLYQNSWDTRIGYYQNQLYNTNFIGYINEVRIWNAARTQQQIQTYMNSSLPNPTTQSGLLAYYTFDNLKNKQGNSAWDGTLGGSAGINQANPNCNPIVNNCPVAPPPCNIIITKNADTTICESAQVKMYATGGTSFSWTPSTGLSNPGIANPIATPVKSTRYFVTVSDKNGCSKKDSVTVNVTTRPIISKSNDTSICINSKVTLFANGGSSYSWAPSSGLSNASIFNPQATPLSTTKYFVTVTSLQGCSKKDSITVIVNNLPVISKSNDTTICIYSTAHLFASGGSSYSWYPSKGLNNPSSPTPVANPLSTTKYYVVVSNGACTQKDSVNIKVNDLPVISKSNDTSICIHSTINLFASGGTSYSWSPVLSLNNSKAPNPIATPATSTTYQVKVTNSYGCTRTDSVKVEIKPVASITKSNDTTVCNKGIARIFIAGGKTYSWFPAASLDNAVSPSPVATPASTTMYYVTIKDQFLCVYKDSVKISVRPPASFFVSPSASVCESNSMQLNASGGDFYLWTPALFLNNPNVNNPVATPDSSVSYSVLIKENTCNESVTLVTRITVFPKPHLTVSKSNDISCTEGSVHLLAAGASEYTWSPAASLDFINISAPVATPLSTTVYTVTGKDVNGCANSDTISVKADFSGNIFYGLPNSFTPNGDGLNDCFGVSNWGSVSQLQFTIYNRFGQRVFYTINPTICWDGTFQGKKQNPDVYVYTIKATMPCGKIDKKGTVTLLR